MSRRRVRRAVMPVAGLGVRFLPATKVVAKELLPLVDTPIVQLAVAEAVAAGIEEIIFVTSRAKRGIEDHFDDHPELERRLVEDDKPALLALLRATCPPGVKFVSVRQPQPLGLGHAVLCARDLIDEDESFAVLLPDDVMDARPPALAQLIDAHHRHQASVVATEEVPRAHVSRYGIVVTDARGRVLDIVEKPAPQDAPSTRAVVGRYVLDGAIFAELARTPPGAGGEIQLTDAIRAMMAHRPVHALQVDGRRFDCGSKLGFVEATLYFAMRHPEVGADVRAMIGALVRAATPAERRPGGAAFVERRRRDRLAERTADGTPDGASGRAAFAMNGASTRVRVDGPPPADDARGA